MFLICGVSQGKKVLDLEKAVICSQCGAFGRYQVFMTYTYFSLFFIPLFKWNRRYYVQMSCCNAVYELNPEAGRAIVDGRLMEIKESDLTLLKAGEGNPYNNRKHCSNCGFETTENYVFCPMCGQHLE